MVNGHQDCIFQWQSWGRHLYDAIGFDQAIKSFEFEQNTNEPCVYKKCKRSVLIFFNFIRRWYSTHWEWFTSIIYYKILVGKSIWYEGLEISQLHFREYVEANKAAK